MSRILWIDDDYEMIRGIVRPLEKAGHEIDPVRTITAALEKLGDESSGQAMPGKVDLARLHILLVERFDEEEMRSLSFGLQVDYDNLRGEGKTGKARELIAYLERRDRLIELVQAGEQLRPDVPWKNVLQTTEGDFSASPERSQYDLVIVDLLLPLYESAQSSIPERIKNSPSGGEGLITYMRLDLDLRIPIIVLSVRANDSEIRDRLEPYQVSDFLTKGDLDPTQVKEAVEKVLNEPNFERAVMLNLRSQSPEERRIGLVHAAQMKRTPKLYETLLDVMGVETVPELRAMAASILTKYPTYTLYSEQTQRVSEDPLGF
ncbi:MAG: hypothetical protein DRJ03_27205 [Chloroflexi bacterium]|nr:MAG: hypothetical protein B6I35_03130 [Anaerolineaceae bacterium 4572_32.2]RLC77238.1 MAG: hypothetical protein DRJ03_27205 [Chloroflexota bacterium]RLC78536.1 MAG: hypothetical protein DRI81_06460 [Chloroflexota bacterium]